MRGRKRLRKKKHQRALMGPLPVRKPKGPPRDRLAGFRYDLLVCDECHGRGWVPEFYGPVDQWGVQDYLEAYCTCHHGANRALAEALHLTPQPR